MPKTDPLVSFTLDFYVPNKEEYLRLASALSSLGPYVMDVEGAPSEWTE